MRGPWRRVLPEVAQRVELLDEAPAARGVADARRVVVVLARADRDAQREAPAGERVEAGGGLGEGGWRVSGLMRMLVARRTRVVMAAAAASVVRGSRLS